MVVRGWRPPASPIGKSANNAERGPFMQSRVVIEWSPDCHTTVVVRG